MPVMSSLVSIGETRKRAFFRLLAAKRSIPYPPVPIYLIFRMSCSPDRLPALTRDFVLMTSKVRWCLQ